MPPATENPQRHSRMYSAVKVRDTFPPTPTFDRAPGNLLLLQGDPVQASAGGSTGSHLQVISFPGQAAPSP